MFKAEFSAKCLRGIKFLTENVHSAENFASIGMCRSSVKVDFTDGSYANNNYADVKH